RTLDPRHPITLGTLVSPDYYPEARHSHHQALLKAETEILFADQNWARICGRRSGGVLTVEGPKEAQIGILSIGSVLGTLQTALEEQPPAQAVKLIKLRAFRPFPAEAIRSACQGLTDLIVLERALSPGGGGIVGLEVLAALTALSKPPRVHNFAAGLGGRDIPVTLLPQLLAAIDEQDNRDFRIIDVELDKLPEEDR
ncbi:MAG: pyruvate ferredoxin oxidoreductase, partial [Pseudomonadota bacterium]|nr:pyruvate ferredoxin oxidoreductase [Pseudomonadota bacterium]